MVKLFVSKHCPVCNVVLNTLKNQEIACDLEIIYVEENPDEADKYNIKAIPTVVDNDKEISANEFIKRCKIKV
jgi:predicted thioredoxin/glutaredoxin